MKYFFSSIVLALAAYLPLVVNAAVEPVAGGYEVSYDINLTLGSSNGSDIVDVFIFEWNEGGDFSVEPAADIAGRGRTFLSHVIGFEPSRALVLGWGAAVPGVGDEKDHLFSLTNASFAERVTGVKWSVAFPGVPPEPRTGHNAMIGLLKAAAGGDGGALDALTTFVQREAGPAAFDPARGSRVIEWSEAKPIDPPVPVPVMPLFGLGLLVLGLVGVTRRLGG